MAITRLNNNSASSITTLSAVTSVPNLASLPSGIPTGKILQVVQTIKTNTDTSSSTSYVDCGMDVTITPSATSSKVMIMCYPRIGCNTQSANIFLKIRNNTAGSDVSSDPFTVRRWASDGQSSYYTVSAPMVVVDSPNTSSSVQYKMQIKTNSGAWTMNMPANTGGYSDVERSTIIAMEIAG